MIVIGWWSSRKVKSLADFLVAGRRLGLVLATSTMFATCFCSSSLIGISGEAYKYGFLGVIADPFGMSAALLLTGLFYASAYRRLNLFTVLDIFGLRYSKSTEIFAAFLTIPVFIGWIGSMMVASGFAISHIFGISSNLSIIIAATIILIYTSLGGMWAISLTDFVQMIILLVGITLIAPFAIAKVGGLAELYQNTPADFLRLIPMTHSVQGWMEYVAKWFLYGLSAVVGQDLIQRSLSSRSESVARWSALTAGIIYFAFGMIVVLLGLAGRILFPDLETPENIVPILAKTFLNPFLLAVFVSGFLALLMSSADSALLAASSLFTNNIVRHMKKGDINEKKLLLITRLTITVVMFLSLLTALYFKQVYNLAINSCATLLVCIFVPATVALFWKKHAHTEGCWFSMLAGFLVWVGYIILKIGSFDIDDSSMGVYYIAAIYGFSASIIAYVLGTLFRFQIRKIANIFLRILGIADCY